MEEEKYTFTDFYHHVISHFVRSLEIVFNTDKNVTPNIKYAHFNRDTKIFRLEVSFNKEDMDGSKLSTEIIKEKH